MLHPGWSRVQAICNWVHSHVTFNYQHARPTKTALDVYTERVGVCRDFQHLAITFCRALNIPARYATGYLGDIGVPWCCPWTSARGSRLARRPVVDIRRPQQHAADWPRPDGHRPRRFRCSHDDGLWQGRPAALLCGHGRREFLFYRPGGTLESASAHLTLSRYPACRSSLRAWPPSGRPFWL